MSSALVARIRARSVAQRVALCLVVLVEAFAVTAYVTGHRDLGGTLTGLVVVAGVCYQVWVRPTRQPHA